MGKASKKKKHGARRFDPMAKPIAENAMSVDDDEAQQRPAREQKPLSAHQQRHMERKRLQQEALELKAQKRKVSKGDINKHKKDKRAIGKDLKVKMARLREVNSHHTKLALKPSVEEQEDDVNEQDAAAPGAAAPFTFNLPVPQRMDEGSSNIVW